MAYHWNWNVFLQPTAIGDDHYLGWLLTGLKWTLTLSCAAWILALAVGTAIGVLRTARRRWVATLASAWVELFRNIPLLVQLFLWYFVLPELLPARLGDAFKQSDPLGQQFVAALVCLGLFTSARVAEQVRAGIESLPPGQAQASRALGLGPWQTYRFVLLPQTGRIIMPPLTSEFLNIFKNSAVATTIGLVELSRQAQQLVDYTAQPYEAFIAVTLLYVLINVTVMACMDRLERYGRLPGPGGGRP